MTPQSERFAAIAASLVLVIGMGFGRFAFTGLYPLMVADGQISVVGGSYAASANYAGYLIGALLAAAIMSRISTLAACAFGGLTTAALLGLLALSLPEWAIIFIRGLAGISSAFALVGATQWIIQDRKLGNATPALFAGVGVGILVSAEIIAYGHAALLSSRAIWFILALVAFALSILFIFMQRRTERMATIAAAPEEAFHEGAEPPIGAARFITLYGLAGFGYIITATYLPLLISRNIATIDPVHVWAVFGASIIPGCYFWHWLHMRMGTSIALMCNLGAQTIGVALPVLHHPAAYIASALLVGGSSIGTVTIAMPAARKLAARVPFNILAIMTASYGLGQIVGPLVANALYLKTHAFDASLLIAAAVLAIAAALSMDRSRAPQ